MLTPQTKQPDLLKSRRGTPGIIIKIMGECNWSQRQFIEPLATQEGFRYGSH
jgi:hypothetical protein